MRSIAGRVAVVSLLLVAACQSGPAGAAISPTPSQTATASAVAPSPSRSALAFSCKLPISDGVPSSGGFVTFPGGQFTSEPSQIVVPRDGARNRTSFGLTYDRGFAKWLPVPRDWVSTDGTRYAYPSSDSILVVSVATGQIVGEYGKGSTWQMVDFENGGIYAYQTQDSTTDPPQPASGGLWVFPFAGAEHIVEGTQTTFPIAVHGTIYYSIDYLSWVGSPYNGTNSGVAWRDLAGNGRGFSFSLNGHMTADRFQVVGVDEQGNAFAWLNTNQLWYAKDSASEHRVEPNDVPRFGPDTYPVLADSHGTWVAAQHGLYLLTPNGFLPRMADKTGDLGGGCV